MNANSMNWSLEISQLAWRNPVPVPLAKIFQASLIRISHALRPGPAARVTPMESMKSSQSNVESMAICGFAEERFYACPLDGDRLDPAPLVGAETRPDHIGGDVLVQAAN